MDDNPEPTLVQPRRPKAPEPRWIVFVPWLARLLPRRLRRVPF